MVASDPRRQPRRLPLAGGPLGSEFPWGWFHVGLSSDLRAGAKRTVRRFGRDLLLYRGRDGRVGLLDAHCPHLGAHLGDGRVAGNTIECRFHRWRFGTDGICTAVPYASRVPRARARAYPVCEWNGIILAWYHPTGAAPTIELPTLDECGAASRSSWHRRSIDVRAPIFDIAENPADVGHFVAVHRYVEPPSLTYEFDGPISSFDQRQKFRVFGVPVPIRLRATSFGPGLSVIRIEQVIDMLVVLTPVPVERDFTQMHFAVMVHGKRALKHAAGLFASWQLGREFRVDQQIWERKVYVPQPVLCDGDGPIMKFRKWYRQFYATEPSAAGQRC
jgi:nitrite reductase/ring-hydroxylating ferredoxin subunit